MIYIQPGKSAKLLKAALLTAVILVLGYFAWLLPQTDKSVQQPEALTSPPEKRQELTRMHDFAGADASSSDSFNNQKKNGLPQSLSTKQQEQVVTKDAMNYLKFQKDFDKWQERLEKDARNVSYSSGKKLINTLPELVANYSLTFAESELVCNMILHEVESDLAVREASIEDCRSKIKAVAPKEETKEDQIKIECENSYRSAELDLVEQFMNLPADQRDLNQLKADLEKARTEIFNSTTCQL